MILDFNNTCNSYDKKKYKNLNIFKCPKCQSVGQFYKHAYYLRNMIYINGNIVFEKQKEILRIICLSCNSTHAILPYDIIPYKIVNVTYILTLLKLLYIIAMLLREITEKLIISYQSIYIYIKQYKGFKSEIINYLRVIEKMNMVLPSNNDILKAILSIKCKEFLNKFLKYNGRPFFFKKFHNNPIIKIYIGMT